MTRIRTLVTLLISLLILMPGRLPLNASPVGPTPIADLVAGAAEMDGREVRLLGEAVGDRMIRGDYAWINVLDRSGTAIGVYLPKDQALKVRNLGEYSRKGDTVDLTGVFHNACPLHDGDPDVHSDVLSVVEQGVSVYHPVNRRRAALSALLLVFAGLMGLAVRRRSLGI